MTILTKHDQTTATGEAAAVLSAVKDRYGFIPNLAAYLAESPLALAAVLKLAEQFEQSSFSPQEQQLIMLTVSTLNGCGYCKTVHQGLGKMAGVDEQTLRALVAFEPLKEARMESLRAFTRAVVEEKGMVSDKVIQGFVDSGFTKAQVFEVVLGVALKTMTNYSNHLADAEPNDEFIAMAAGRAAA